MSGSILGNRVVRREDGEHHLFDLRNDPDEKRNLSQRRQNIAATHRVSPGASSRPSVS